MLAKYKYVFLLVILFFTLRLFWLSENFFFGFEQGRDFLKLNEIFSGNLTLIGPKTDIDGVFHGALSYYLPLPLFIILGGNPFFVLVSYIAIHSFSLIFLFTLLKKDMGRWAYVSCFLYAISYSSIVYNRWLSNPNLVPALTIFVLYFLHKATKEKSYFVAVVFFWAVIFHLQVIAAFILLLPLVYFSIINKLFTKKNIAVSFVLLLVIMSPYILFNLRNENILVSSLVSYFSEKHSQSVFSLDEFYNETVSNFFPASREVALIFFAVILSVNFLSAWKNRFSKHILLLYVSAPFLFYVLQAAALRHFYMLNSLFVILLVTNATAFLSRWGFPALAVILLTIFVYGNLQAIYTRLPESHENFIHHAQRTYFKDQLKLIDYVYGEAKGAKFYYDYYTVPYWQPEAWRYLFSWYGKSKYGYEPLDNRTEIYYVLIEPDEGQPEYQKNWYNDLNLTSKLLDEHTSGKLKAEKRQEI